MIYNSEIKDDTIIVEYRGIIEFMDFVRQMVVIYDDLDLDYINNKIVDMRKCQFDLTPREARIIAYIAGCHCERHATKKITLLGKSTTDTSVLNILKMECEYLGVKFQVVLK